MNDYPNLKITIMGQGGSGKSTTIIKFIQNFFVEDYDPTIEDSYQKQLKVKEKVYMLDILDTVFGELDWGFRARYIKETDILVLLYSITSKSSFQFLKDEEFMDIMRGIGEEKEYSIIVVGNKKDLENERQVTTKEGEEFAEEIGAYFVESSAKTDDLEPLFEKIVTYHLEVTADNLPQDLLEDLENLFEKQILIDYQFEVNNGNQKIGCHRIFLEQRLGEEHFENLKQILFELPLQEAKFVLKNTYCGLSNSNYIQFNKILKNSKIDIPKNLFRSKKLKNDLNEMLNSQTHDLCLIVENEEIYFHKIFLIARFGYFEKLFSKKQNQEIEKLTDQTGISLKIWKILRTYIYNGEIIEGIDDKKSCQELFKALKKLKIHSNFSLKDHFQKKFKTNKDCILM
ncbi:ras-like protein rasu-related [Anaeramoeba flamelloides]|uniref:Ras-like protein rasu-related n=1 Tax=Anaeramoeba flamelloides TaxID=1746091 RepID=A0AAV7Z569_9EUKA|nr:ras-like protein rasu-related [Anaeramoeba flamelloides]